MRALILAGATLVGSCYHPSFESCHLFCANSDHACPSGLECDLVTNRCRAGADDCSGSTDAAVDAAPDSPPDTPPNTSCVWPAPNVEPCNLHADDSVDDWTVTLDTELDTGGFATSNTPPKVIGGTSLPNNSDLGAGFEKDGATQIAILVLRNITINAGVTLTVIGERPLVVVVQNANINGTIRVTTSGSCATGNGQDGMTPPGAIGKGAGGGGGASYGVQRGAAGGAGAGGTGHGSGGAAGMPGGASDLVPLTGGCRGGRGGAIIQGGTGVDGGGGGGAIQISAFDSISVLGAIDTGGTGGKGATAASGGGGGGAGGAILLDALQMMTTAASTQLCSNGGGGGAGADGTDGQDARCSESAATGGDGADGNGATGTAAAVIGQPGTGTTGLINGGGGGGGCGLIHFTRAPATPMGLTTPDPT